MRQTTLDRYTDWKCDLEGLFRAVVASEDWERVRTVAEAYVAEGPDRTMCWLGGYPDDHGGTPVLTLCTTNGPSLSVMMCGDVDEDRTFGTGMFSLHAEWDFAWARRDYDWYLSLDNKGNLKALETHRRFFEMLAEAFGMVLGGWGPERHVDWQGAAWR